MIKLQAIDGVLYFPHGGIDTGYGSTSWEPEQDRPSILIRRYPAGDVDTIPFPFPDNIEKAVDALDNLRRALFDERECNEFFHGNVDAVALPDGSIVYF